MDTRNLQLGDWFADQRYGAGMVSFVGHDYVGVRFDARLNAGIGLPAVQFSALA